MWTRIAKGIMTLLIIIISIVIIYVLIGFPHLKLPHFTTTNFSKLVAPLPIQLPPQHEAVQFPDNGTIEITWNAEAIARFEIHTESADTYHYIKLENIVDNSQKVFVYVHPKSVTTVKVPLGKYNLYIASGNTWYGKDLIFGDFGTYEKALEIFDFYKVENENETAIQGFTLTLKTATGNLKSTPTNKDDFA